MPRIETLKLDHPTMPDLDLCRVGHKSIGARTGEIYSLGLSGYGFEIDRPLSLDDLAAIRDWCIEVIVADAEVPAVAAE